MSDDIRAKAQPVLVVSVKDDYQQLIDVHRDALVAHVATLEARLDLALAGCMQTREWLQSDEAWDAASDAVAGSDVRVSSYEATVIRKTLAALSAAMPGGDV